MMYKIIETAIRDHIEQLSVPEGVSENEVYMCIKDIMRKNPDIFWFSHQWIYLKEEKIIRFLYTINKEKSENAKKQIEDVIQKDFNITKVYSLSVSEQIMYVYKWIALYCKYNIYSAYNQTIYSVFVHRNSVCTGYAKAAQYLFKLLGIECRLVFGTMHQAEKGSRHCWLLVMIENNWYHFDPTFAVPDINHLLRKAGVNPIYGADGLIYNYFCCDTKNIMHSRIIEDENELPSCTSTIDYKPLQDIPIHLHRMEGLDPFGIKGCLLSETGSFSTVYLWHSKYYPQSVLKVYKANTSHELIYHEWHIMRHLRKISHVLHTYGLTEEENGIIIEQATPLADLLCCHYYHLSAMNFCRLLLDVLAGLHNCISNGIYYRDIHINNIYRNSNGTYLLGDFGSCIWIENDNPSILGGIGSPWYSSPETYLNGLFNKQSAIYGFGMLAYFLLNELFPPLWNEYGEDSLKHRIQGEALPPPELLRNPSCAFEQQMATIVLKCISYEPANRYMEFTDLENDIRKCLFMIDDDYLLIDGGSSERFFKKDKKENIDNISYNTHTYFHMTCWLAPEFFPNNDHLIDSSNNDRRECAPIPDFHSTNINGSDVLVSNGEDVEINFVGVEEKTNGPSEDNIISFKTSRTDAALIDVDGDGTFDIMATDTNRYCAIDQSEIVDISDSMINAEDLARIAGNPFDYKVSNDDIFEPSTCSSSPSRISHDSHRIDRINDFASTAIGSMRQTAIRPTTYCPQSEYPNSFNNSRKKSVWSRIFRKKEKGYNAEKVYSSIFAPAEVRPKSRMVVQVYLHLLEETDMVNSLAKETQKDAVRRDYIPLQCKLKNGDQVDVRLNIYGESLLLSEKKSLVWQGSFTKCSFDYFVPKDIKIVELCCVAVLTVNGAQVGEMRFVTIINEQPRDLHPEVFARQYKKIFISYAHQDESKVQYIARAYDAQGVDYFFDRHYLKPGDIFPLKIKEYIDSADLFILCWSANAAKSDYVELERKQALERAFPKVKPFEDAPLSIYPMSIEPRAELPVDMRDTYNFEVI